MQERENALKEWLNQTLNQKEFFLTKINGDASFRRYFRVQSDGAQYIVMDAPPEQEDIQPFIHIAKRLSEAEVYAPEIIAKEEKQGFLLLTDFGDQLLLNELSHESADTYYHNAIDTIIKIQGCSINDPKLPAFNKEFMLKEMSLCPEWFLHQFLKLSLTQDEQRLIQNSMNWIAEEVEKQALVFIHRDYHSRNLMVLGHPPQVVFGVIDFQDAMKGPLTYDLVSLLKDCYISWPREHVLEWIGYFHTRSTIAQRYSFKELVRAFDICGIQRHIKVLGVFCRLYLRDGKNGYLADLPRTLRYVLECADLYEELHPLYRFFNKRVQLP